MAVWNPVALSAMYAKHLGLGAVMADAAGWRLPARYTSAAEEIERLRQGVGISDVSSVGKISVQGERVDWLMSTTLDDVDAPDVGVARRGQLSDGSAPGGVLLARLTHDEVLVLTDPGEGGAVSGSLTRTADGCVHVVDVTSALAGVRIVGPLAGRLLAAVSELDTSPGAFPDMCCAQTRLAEVHGTLVRHDVAGLPSYDLYIGREYGEYMWDALMEAGEEHGIVPVGTEAMAFLK